jgi:hypothetical protein
MRRPTPKFAQHAHRAGNVAGVAGFVLGARLRSDRIAARAAVVLGYAVGPLSWTT